jgi:hypothetical protein
MKRNFESQPFKEMSDREKKSIPEELIPSLKKWAERLTVLTGAVLGVAALYAATLDYSIEQKRPGGEFSQLDKTPEPDSKKYKAVSSQVILNYLEGYEYEEYDLEEADGVDSIHPLEFFSESDIREFEDFWRNSENADAIKRYLKNGNFDLNELTNLSEELREKVISFLENLGEDQQLPINLLFDLQYKSTFMVDDVLYFSESLCNESWDNCRINKPTILTDNDYSTVVNNKFDIGANEVYNELEYGKEAVDRFVELGDDIEDVDELGQENVDYLKKFSKAEKYLLQSITENERISFEKYHRGNMFTYDIFYIGENGERKEKPYDFVLKFVYDGDKVYCEIKYRHFSKMAIPVEDLDMLEKYLLILIEMEKQAMNEHT